MQLRSLDTTIDGFADCLNNQHSHRRRNKTHDIKDEVNVRNYNSCYRNYKMFMSL